MPTAASICQCFRSSIQGQWRGLADGRQSEATDYEDNEGNRPTILTSESLNVPAFVLVRQQQWLDVVTNADFVPPKQRVDLPSPGKDGFNCRR